MALHRTGLLCQLVDLCPFSGILFDKHANLEIGRSDYTEEVSRDYLHAPATVTQNEDKYSSEISTVLFPQTK